MYSDDGLSKNSEDWGFRIGDWGLRIEDWRLRIVDWRLTLSIVILFIVATVLSRCFQSFHDSCRYHIVHNYNNKLQYHKISSFCDTEFLWALIEKTDSPSSSAICSNKQDVRVNLPFSKFPIEIKKYLYWKGKKIHCAKNKGMCQSFLRWLSFPN